MADKLILHFGTTDEVERMRQPKPGQGKMRRYRVRIAEELEDWGSAFNDLQAPGASNEIVFDAASAEVFCDAGNGFGYIGTGHGGSFKDDGLDPDLTRPE